VEILSNCRVIALSAQLVEQAALSSQVVLSNPNEARRQGRLGFHPH
jgi:hypothetical protein